MHGKQTLINNSQFINIDKNSKDKLFLSLWLLEARPLLCNPGWPGLEHSPPTLAPWDLGIQTPHHTQLSFSFRVCLGRHRGQLPSSTWLRQGLSCLCSQVAQLYISGHLAQELPAKRLLFSTPIFWHIWLFTSIHGLSSNSRPQAGGLVTLPLRSSSRLLLPFFFYIYI